MLDEHALLTVLVTAGSSPLFARQVQSALSTLAPDQRLLAVQLLCWIVGKAPVPVLVPTPPPLERSAHEAPTLY